MVSRPTYALTLQPMARCPDDIRALRAMLKQLLRYYQLRCLSIRPTTRSQSFAERQKRGGATRRTRSRQGEIPMSNGDDYDSMYGSKYLAATELKAPTKATIDRVGKETFKKPGEPDRTKAVLFFVGAKKALAVNKTNADALAAAYGRDFDDWVGKRVTIKAEHTTFGGKRVLGLRLYSGTEVKPEHHDRVGGGGNA
jgi:hypothetical protein